MLNAFGAEIQKESINIIVNKTEKPLIEESYFISFSDENELNSFKQEINDGISAETLTGFGLEIKSKIEENKGTISFEEQDENNKIKLNYSSDEIFLINKRVLFDEFVLNKDKFSFLLSGNKIVFPENFSLRFVLPNEAKSITAVPETKVFSKTVEFTGINSAEFSLGYLIEKTPEEIAIKQTKIEIEVKENGFGFISEKYFFEFRNQEELTYFTEKAENNSSSLLSWIAFDSRIFPHIKENELDLKNASVEFVEKGLENSYLQIIYENETPIFIEKKERQGRFVEWEFNLKKLNEFTSSGLIIFPENFILEITLPLNSEIKETDLEKQNKKIILQGYKSTSKISIIYVIKENIAPTFNLSLVIQKIISDKETSTIIAGIIILILVIVYLKKDSLIEKTENFIIKNSSIEKREQTEIEIDE